MAAAGLSVISSFNNENRNILKNDDLPKAKSNKEVKVCIFITERYEIMVFRDYKSTIKAGIVFVLILLRRLDFCMSSVITVLRLYSWIYVDSKACFSFNIFYL
jgi:hypothetical protein